ncbi:hypothetical protein M407DRAFT_218605 [Tulasnella calospora MUT 4182]|uniref:Uncharacterized protein n=1 Tax=Tulasnella calospora MUT 4182 TaxID=1051891 RepID=A0A0C3QYN7_9AGAM|nr:hypothetical protein M407DRAFT_218605 [Tulasnella calospora MUT 4182]
MDLERYAAEATLPEMRSPGNWSLRVPHTNYPSIPDAGVLPAEDEKGVQTWVEQVALQTALCLLHSAEPELLDLEFGHVSGAGTRGALSDVVFRLGNPHGRQTSKVNTLLVEVKCPWTLSRSDMQQISRVADGVRFHRLASQSTSLNSSYTFSFHRRPLPTKKTTIQGPEARSVLAQVYDYCKEQGHCFWIITNYEHWVFGVFSAKYDTGLATDPIPYYNNSPTVLQCIVYWLQSSTFRAGAFEIPKVMRFSAPSSRGLWVDTLRCWRENGLQELGPKFAGAGYNNPDSLFAKCAESLERRNSSVDLASTWYGDTLQDSCRKALQLLQTPSHHLQWTVVLTWLALLLEPVSVTSELPCLQTAFKVACREEIHKPNLLHWKGQESSSHFRHSQGVDPTWPEIWSAGTAVRPVESLKEFYWNNASHEVAFILDKYLPSSIQDQLQEILARLRLLGPASPEPQLEGLGSDSSSQTEEATPEREVITERARSKRPSKPRRSDASATRASPGLLQDTVTLWRRRAKSENAAEPSSASREASRPSTTAYSTYRSDSNSPGSPATPMTRKGPNRPLFSPSSEGTPGSGASPGSLWSAAGKDDEEEEGKIGSLMERLGGLAIGSPPPYESSARPRSTARSPVSTNNGERGDRNLFFEPAQSLTIPARIVNDCPRQSPTNRSERSEGGAPPNDEGIAEIEEVLGER